MNIEQTRFNMVAQQIRPWYVFDDTVLDLLYKLKREEFVPAEHRDMAFIDMEIPLGHGQVMMTPKMEARIVQELHIQKTDKILEIGTGSGYLTALLAEKGAHVTSVEIIPELKAMAENNLKKHGITNVTLELGDGAQGWPQHGPYDVIVLTGSTPVLPDTFQNNLNPGGRLFAIVGEDPVMQALIVTCIAPGQFTTTNFFETSVPSLINARQPVRFSF